MYYVFQYIYIYKQYIYVQKGAGPVLGRPANMYSFELLGILMCPPWLFGASQFWTSQSLVIICYNNRVMMFIYMFMLTVNMFIQSGMLLLGMHNIEFTKHFSSGAHGFRDFRRHHALLTQFSSCIGSIPLAQTK